MYLVEILERCSAAESRVASIYRSLANRFQDRKKEARLWRELALEEETHADILTRELRSFEEREDSGAFLPGYRPRLEHVESLLADLADKAQSMDSLDDGLALAVALEQAELEDLYDDLVTQGQPAFKLISERLEAMFSRTPMNTAPELSRKHDKANSPGSG